MKSKSFIKTTSIFMIVTLIGKFLALLKDSMVARGFGTTYVTDAYLISMTIPTILYDIIGIAITTTFIPILSERYENEGKEEMIKLANNIMNIFIVVAIILFIISELFVNKIVGVIVPNFSKEAYELTVSLTKISLINILFMSQINGLLAILQVFGEFRSSAIISVITNVALIVYIIVFSSNLKIEGLLYATIISYILQLILQVVWLRKYGYNFTRYLNIKDKSIKKILIMILPVIVGTGVSELNILVDKVLASSLVEGSITAYSYGTKVANLLHSVFGYSIVVITYPVIASLINKKDKNQLSQYIQDKINFIFVTILPLTLLVIIFSEEIIEILFKSNSFDSNSVRMTSNILVIMSIGLLFMSIRDICNRVYYSLDNTKTPTRNSIIGMLINMILGVILIGKYNINGLAVASSISIIISCVLMLIDVNKWLGEENKLRIFIIIKQMYIPILSMLISSIYIKHIFNDYNNIIMLILGCLGGGISYIILLILVNKELQNKIIYEFSSRLYNKNI